MNPRMPPLPEPRLRFDVDTTLIVAGEAGRGTVRYEKGDPLYPADQLLSAQRAAWNAAIQCSMEEMQRQRQKWDGPFYRCSEVLEDAIRSLKEPE